MSEDAKKNVKMERVMRVGVKDRFLPDILRLMLTQGKRICLPSQEPL